MPTILLALNPTDASLEQKERIRSLQPNAKIILTDNRDEIEPLLPEIEILAAAPFRLHGFRARLHCAGTSSGAPERTG